MRKVSCALMMALMFWGATFAVYYMLSMVSTDFGQDNYRQGQVHAAVSDDWVVSSLSPASGCSPYNRADWPHWIDADGDGEDTRQEVLAEESLVPVRWIEWNGKRRVVEGLWACPYTGAIFTKPADYIDANGQVVDEPTEDMEGRWRNQLDVDHLVALKDAHLSGGCRWTRERRRAFANNLDDPDRLVAVSSSANRSRGSKGPAAWMPEVKAVHCEMVIAYARAKRTEGLEVSPEDAQAIVTAMATCPVTEWDLQH